MNVDILDVAWVGWRDRVIDAGDRLIRQDVRAPT